MITIKKGIYSEEMVETIANFQQMMAKESEDMELDLSVVIAGVKAIFGDPSKGSYYLAYNGDIPVGCLLTTYEWSDWRNATILWIQSVYTHPGHRNCGVFTALYVHLKELVESSTEFAGLRLYVEKNNTSAQQVYDKMGMSDEHYHLYEWLK